MSMYEIVCLIGLVVTHAAMYYLGKSDAKPSDEAWVAVQCHSIDKRFEHERWLKERADETAKTASSSDQ